MVNKDKVEEAAKDAWDEWHRGWFGENIPKITPSFVQGFKAAVVWMEEKVE